MADFALPKKKKLKIDFTENLSYRKIMKFPHCADSPSSSAQSRSVKRGPATQQKIHACNLNT